MRIKKTSARWFEIPGDPDGARIKIKHLKPKELSEINDKAFPQKIDYKKSKDGQFEPVIIDKSDGKLYRDLPIIFSVVEWENFYDEKGKDLKCTDENIQRCIDEIEGFSSMVNEFRDIMAKDILQERKQQQKN